MIIPAIDIYKQGIERDIVEYIATVAVKIGGWKNAQFRVHVDEILLKRKYIIIAYRRVTVAILVVYSVLTVVNNIILNSWITTIEPYSKPSLNNSVVDYLNRIVLNQNTSAELRRYINDY